MLRLGMIGAGHFAKAHVEALAEQGDRIALVAVARRHGGRPFPEAEALGARPMDVESLLASGLDAVTICATNDLHRPLAEAALAAGKHVFCEKPLAMYLDDARAVVHAAEEAGRVLMVGHVTRCTALYIEAARWASPERLGTPLVAYANRMHVAEGRPWRMHPEKGGGILFDLLIHDFDLLAWIMGVPQSVLARGHRHPAGAYDRIGAVFDYGDGRIATVEGGLYLQAPCGVQSTLRIVCEGGHIEVRTPPGDGCAPLLVHEAGKPPQGLEPAAPPGPRPGLVAEYDAFLDAIAGKPGPLRVEDACLAVAYADRTRRAADTGAPVPFRLS